MLLLNTQKSIDQQDGSVGNINVFHCLNNPPIWKNTFLLSCLKSKIGQLRKSEWYIQISGILKKDITFFLIIFVPILIWSAYDPNTVWYHASLIEKFDEKVNQEESIQSQWRLLNWWRSIGDWCKKSCKP